MWVPRLDWLGQNWYVGTKMQKEVDLRGWFFYCFYKKPKSRDCDIYGIKTAIKPIKNSLWKFYDVH